MTHPPDETSPRRRLRDWIEARLAADPGLDAHELTRRALDRFADDQELLDLAYSKAVGQEVTERLIEQGYRPDPERPGLWRPPEDTEP